MADRTYRFVVRLGRAGFALLGLRIEVRGAEHLPRAGGAVLASNHVSSPDFLFVGLVGRERGRYVRFLAKHGVFLAPVVGDAMRAMRHIEVDRAHGEVALRHAVEAVRAGEVVGIFPEATTSHSWELRPFRPGSAALAAWCQVPLVPVAVWGSHRIGRSGRGGRFGVRRGVPVTIVVGEPLRPAPDADPYAVAEQLRSRVAVLLGQAMDAYPEQPRDDGDWWWLPRSRGGTAPTRAEGLRIDEEGMRRADLAAERRARRSRRRSRTTGRRARHG